MDCSETAAHGSLARRRGFGGHSSSFQSHLLRESSLFLPCAALAANVRSSLVEWEDASGQADGIQDRVCPLACTQQASKDKAPSGHLPVGSDVRLPLFFPQTQL